MSSHIGYWQQFVPGWQFGVTCLVTAQGSRCLGATINFDQSDWYGPTEFIYRGSVGPIILSPQIQVRIEKLCDAYAMRSLHRMAAVRFLQSIDDAEQLWLLECNPRWTAGMEALLHGEGVNMVQQHLSALGIPQPSCNTQSIPNASRTATTSLFAKAIVYARNTINLTQPMIDALHQASCEAAAHGFSWLADIPYAPQTIDAGHPIATVRLRTKDADSNPTKVGLDDYAFIKRNCIPQLEQLAERLAHLLRSTSHSKV